MEESLRPDKYREIGMKVVYLPTTGFLNNVELNYHQMRSKCNEKK